MRPVVLLVAIVFLCPAHVLGQRSADHPAILASWRVENLHIAARIDGLVELALDFGTRIDLGNFSFRSQFGDIYVEPRFRPHRRIASPDEIAAGLRDSQCPSASVAFTPTVQDYIDARPERFVALLDSAARIARSHRPEPAPLDSLVARDESTVTCPAALRFFEMPMPAAPAATSRLTETVARFVVRPSGRVDTATVEFVPALDAEHRKSAVKALASWVLQPALLAGKKVSQRVHVPIVFVNRVHGDTLAQARSFEAVEWTARSDGLLEWVHPRNKLVRGLFERAHVQSWLALLQRLISAAPTDSREIRNTLPSAANDPGVMYAPEMPQPNALEWNTTLGVPGSTTLSAGLYWTRSDPASLARVQVYATTCHGQRVRVEAGLPGEVETIVAADSALKMIAATTTAEPDYSRVFGERGVSCPAVREGVPEDVMTEDYLIARRLALRSDAVAVFVVAADGRVEGSSINFFAGQSAPEKIRIRAEVGKLRFQPARIRNTVVRQRMHYHIPATADHALAVDPLTKTVCRVVDNTALRATIMRPVEGIQRSTLDQLWQQVVQLVADQKADSMKMAGQFNFVVLPHGEVRNVSWKKSPIVPETLRPEFGAFWWGQHYAVPVTTARPVGVEVTIGGSC